MLTHIRYGDGQHEINITSYEEDDRMIMSLSIISPSAGTAKVEFTEKEAKMFCKQLVNFLGEED